MSEYIIELPDSGAADEFVAKMGVDDCRIYGYRLNGEIVRCRDCVYYEPNTYSHFTCELLTFHVEPDGFCAWGERRER